MIEHADVSLWALGIKRSLWAKVEKGFYIACKDLQPARSFVVHAGEDRYPVTDNIEAIGVHKLALVLSD